jgi:phosphate/sulfate permease
MDMFTIVILSICVLVPFAAAVVAIAIVVYPPRFASAIKDLKDLQADFQSSKSGAELKVKPSVGLTVLLLFSAISLCFAAGLVALIFAIFLNIP